LGTVRVLRLPGCSLKTDGLKKLGRGANDNRNEAGTNVKAFKWYDNKPAYLVVLWSEIARAVRRAGKTTTRKMGRSVRDSPTLALVNKKRVRNSAKMVDDVRCDCVGHWPAHTEIKQRCRLCIKAYSRVKCVNCEKAFPLTKDKNCFVAYHIKQWKVNIFVPWYVCLEILSCLEHCFRKMKRNVL